MIIGTYGYVIGSDAQRWLCDGNRVMDDDAEEKFKNARSQRRNNENGRGLLRLDANTNGNKMR